MRITFWGVRGSIPTPGPATLQYGGNTTCIEIRTADGDLLILDAGTGIHALAQSLKAGDPADAHILITHTHWDHIHGLPFFSPILIPGNRLTIYGGQDPVTGEGIERALSVQLQYSYFPIREAELKANVQYVTLKPDATAQIGSASVTPVLLNHPVLNFGYRIEADGKALFFTGDYEPPFNIYAPEDKEFQPYQEIVDGQLLRVTEAMADVDVLIVDASYTEEEYPAKMGWGHGTYQAAIEQAAAAHAGQLIFTHHEPGRSDAQLDAIFAEISTRHGGSGIRYHMAREGMQIDL